MTSKINVLQVIPKLGYGGAETGCYDIAHYLAEQDCGSYIATSGGDLLKFIKKDKVKVFRFPVHFHKRIHGHSSWNIDFKSKYKFIKRTLDYSFQLKRNLN